MKIHQKPGTMLICLALLITIATLVIAGCLESTSGQQEQMTAAMDKQSESPAAGTVVSIREIFGSAQFTLR